MSLGSFTAKNKGCSGGITVYQDFAATTAKVHRLQFVSRRLSNLLVRVKVSKHAFLHILLVV